MTAEIEANPDWQALYAGILADPFNDLRRLVAADWLEEHGRSRDCLFLRDGIPDFPCRGGQVQDMIECKDGVWRNGWRDCPACGGRGVVADGVTARAEFIRLQVESDSVPTMTSAKDRAMKLWLTHYHEWNRPWVEAGERFHFNVAVDTTLADQSPVPVWGFIRKGFLSEFRCPLADWLRIGPDLVRLFPVIFVSFPDRTPATHNRHTIDTRSFPLNRPFWTAHERDDGVTSRDYGHWIPRAVFDLLPFDDQYQPHRPNAMLYTRSRRTDTARYYPDTVSAIKALSTASLLWARASSASTSSSHRSNRLC